MEFVTQRRRTGSAASRPCSSFKRQTDRSDPIAPSNGVHPASKVGEGEEGGAMGSDLSI